MSRTIKTPEFGARLGTRIREARVAAKLSQGALGEIVGVSFQQIQKYELGKDRVSAEGLVRIAEALGRPAAELLDLDSAVVVLGGAEARERGHDLRERGRIADAVLKLPPEVRKRVMAMVEAIAASMPAAAEPEVAMPDPATQVGAVEDAPAEPIAA